MQSLKDKVIWITGASSGIGEALAYECAKRNAKLVLSARRENELNRVAKNCGLPPENILIIPFDLSNTNAAAEYATTIITKFGAIDVLINNGGQSQRSEAISTSSEIERRLFEINYFSAVNLSKAVLPHMLKNKTGKIVVTSSIAGKFGFYLRSTYSAAKHALNGYFDSLRLEVENKGVSVLIVSPGKVKTQVSINAQGEEGTKHNKMDESHEDAMSAEECARRIISGMCNNKEELLIGGQEVIAVKLKRFFPRLFGKIIRKQNPY